MAGGGDAGGEGGAVAGGNLEYTPTWTVAITCTVFVILTLLLERIIHTLTKRWKGKEDQEYKLKVLVKMKDELMLLGFISLILTALQTQVSKICIPTSWTDNMLPCQLNAYPAKGGATGNRRKLFQFSDLPQRRFLAAGESSTHCADQGKSPFLSTGSIHQLHIFIFVLAVVHIFLTFLTMVLGRYKIHRWGKWEKEIASADQENMQQEVLKLTKEDGFISKHAHRFWSNKPIFRWVVCFFRQFFNSVAKDDYTYMRRGFINMHLAGNNKYDFHRYIMRSLEEDFKKVVGISWPLWVFVIVFMLLNVHGWDTYFWISFVPLILLLIVGAKLKIVVTEMAIEVANKQSVVQGDVVIKPRDELFWFKKPKVLLSLMHFILFQNAFEFAYFFWVWMTFGFNSCLLETVPIITIRLIMGVFVQFFFSYVTLPLYALVTQMGSQYKAAIMTKAVTVAAKGWLDRAKRKRDKGTPLQGMDGAKRDLELNATTSEDYIDQERKIHEDPLIGKRFS